jgi:hypothetical protein
MTTKEFPGPDGLHMGDKVTTLADYEVFNLTPLEILNLSSSTVSMSEALEEAHAKVLLKWQKLSEEQPERLDTLYNNLLGE